MSSCSPITPDDHLGLPILSFADAAAWEVWLAQEPRTSPGVWLKLAKKSAGVAYVGQAAAVDAVPAARIATFVAMCAAGVVIH